MKIQRKSVRNEWAQAFLAAFPHTVPVLTGFLTLGFAFGVLMRTKGYGPLWPFFMSAVCYCGSMQFVALTLLSTAFDPLAAFLMSLMINARHLFYGIAMLDKYRGLGKLRPVLICTLCDETFSILSGVTPPSQMDAGKFYFCVSLLDYSYWALGSALGGLAGGLITFNTKGLDFALTALFIVLLTDQMREKDNRPPALMGIGVSALALVVFGASGFVLPAMALLMLLLIAWRKPLCR